MVPSHPTSAQQRLTCTGTRTNFSAKEWKTNGPKMRRKWNGAGAVCRVRQKGFHLGRESFLSWFPRCFSPPSDECYCHRGEGGGFSIDLLLDLSFPRKRGSIACLCVLPDICRRYENPGPVQFYGSTQHSRARSLTIEPADYLDRVARLHKHLKVSVYQVVFTPFVGADVAPMCLLLVTLYLHSA